MSGRNATVLIVEDDDIDVESVTRGMKKRYLAFDVHATADGSRALEFLRSELTPDQRSRLIVLLDLNMPRMNGHEFLAEIRSGPILHQTIVFVLTTSSLESDRSRAYERNIAGYFVVDRGLGGDRFRGSMGTGGRVAMRVGRGSNL